MFNIIFKTYVNHIMIKTKHMFNIYHMLNMIFSPHVKHMFEVDNMLNMWLNHVNYMFKTCLPYGEKKIMFSISKSIHMLNICCNYSSVGTYTADRVIFDSYPSVSAELSLFRSVEQFVRHTTLVCFRGHCRFPLCWFIGS
jgi:hypothetical protein